MECKDEALSTLHATQLTVRDVSLLELTRGAPYMLKFNAYCAQISLDVEESSESDEWSAMQPDQQ